MCFMYCVADLSEAGCVLTRTSVHIRSGLWPSRHTSHFVNCIKRHYRINWSADVALA